VNSRVTQAVLFDLDDTLFDHAHATRAALAALHLSEPALGRWAPPELERRHAEILEVLHVEVLAGRLPIDRAREERFRRLLVAADFGGEASLRSLDLARAYRVGYEGAWRAVPGALPLLAALKQEGLAVAVVTNNLTVEQSAKMARCGITPFVDALITSEEVGATKPDARIFETALRRVGARSHEAVMVGDAWVADVTGARAAGIRAIWFNRHGGARRDPDVAEVASLEPVDALLELLRGNDGR